MIGVKFFSSKSEGKSKSKLPKKTLEPESMLKINSKLFESISLANEELIFTL